VKEEHIWINAGVKNSEIAEVRRQSSHWKRATHQSVYGWKRKGEKEGERGREREGERERERGRDREREGERERELMPSGSSLQCACVQVGGDTGSPRGHRWRCVCVLVEWRTPSRDDQMGGKTRRESGWWKDVKVPGYYADDRNISNNEFDEREEEKSTSLENGKKNGNNWTRKWRRKSHKGW